MLKLQVQGRGECLPTSIAMILGVPKQQVLDLFQNLDPLHRTFTEIYRGNSNTFWPCTWRVLDHAFGPAAVKAYQETVGWNGEDGRGGLWATGGKGAPAPFPQTGRGLLQLIFASEDGRFMRRHTVAYSEGLLYDPAEQLVCTWEEYEARCPGWKIEGVIPTP